MEKQELRKNIIMIEQKIKQACEKSDRNLNDVKLLVVTKTVTSEIIKNLAALNIKNIGENRVLNANKKYHELKSNQLVWHMIGHLQTNKVKMAVSIFDIFHSVDSVKLAREISKHTKVPKKVFLQVNISKEKSKYGFLEEQLEQEICEITKLENLDICGLMAMAPFTENSEICRECFRNTKLLAERLRDKGHIPKESLELSMGMSRDFEIAIEEGSTIVRVGSAIYQGLKEESVSKR